MPDFLLELRTEEIPARTQAGARAALEKAFREHMASQGVTHGAVTVWSTPRRLALIARGLPLETAPQREEIKGPRVSAPPQALEGFLRKVGLPQEKLEDRGGTWFAIIERPGRATSDVLAWAIAAIVRTFPWPKAMRWGAASVSTESPRWVRPLSGIVAILGEELVECTAAGVSSGYATLGHRFHAPGPITIGGAGDYREKLRACHVIVDHAEREALIREKAAAAAAQAGLTLVADEGLVIENAGLTEWPVPLLGRFDEAFLEVPPEVIQLTARTNQKYFVCLSSPSQMGRGTSEAGGGLAPAGAPIPLHHPADGPPPHAGHGEESNLANAFVCTANIEAADGGAAIVDGNRKVLAARLSDARFFWEQDRRKTLEEHSEKLANIVFHEKLGTVADKVERVAKLARWLVEEGIVGLSSPSQMGRGTSEAGGGVTLAGARIPLHHPADGPPPHAAHGEESAKLADPVQLADWAEQAARLCKADLVTEMVGEFPELQGLMGGYYARAEGLPDQVADAIRDHYKPVGQGDEVPTAPVTVAVSLADKLDTLVGFFGVKQFPTGSRDPFALRRAALGVIELAAGSNLRFSLGAIFILLSKEFGETFARQSDETIAGDIEAANRLGVIEQIDRAAYVQRVAAMIGRDEIAASFAEGYGALTTFFADRLKVQQREAGVRHDLIDAVFALGGEDDLVRLLARVHALQAFVGTADGANLLAGYKRAANILKKEGYLSPLPTGEGSGVGAPRPPASAEHPHPTLPLEGEDFQGGNENYLSYTPEPAERALIEALDAAEPKARDAVAAEDFAGAMGALASLRGPIDAFFDSVTVNDSDERKRAARLGLLERFRGAVHAVADFSKIEG